MPDNQAKITITAEDLASPVIAKVGDSMQGLETTATSATAGLVQVTSSSGQLSQVLQQGTGSWQQYGGAAREAIGSLVEGGPTLMTTVSEIGLLGVGAEVAGAAFVGWEIGKKIGEWTGLTNAIEHATDRLMGWNLAAETAGAKQDTINKAIAEGAPKTIAYGDAIQFLNSKFEEQQKSLKQYGGVWEEYQKAVANGGASLEGVSAATRGLVKDFEDLKFSHEKIAIATGLTVAQVDLLITGWDKSAAAATRNAAAVKKAAEAHQQFLDSIHSLTTDAVGAGKGNMGMFGALIDGSYGHGGAISESLDIPFLSLDAALKQLPPDVDYVQQSMHLFSTNLLVVGQSATTAGHAIETGLSAALDRLPDIMERAFEGGGGAAGAAKAFGVDLGANLGKEIESPNGPLASILPKSLDNVFGKALGAVGAGLVGAGIGALGGLLSKIGGPDQAELDTRKDRTAAGITDATSIQATADQLQQVGYSAAQARDMLNQVLDAKKPAAFAAAMAPVKAAMQQNLDTSTAVGQVTTLVSAFTNAGHVIPQNLRDTLTSLSAMKGLTADEQTALKNLTDASKPNFESLESEANGLGISLAALGPKFEQGDLEQKSADLYGKIQDLTNAGGDLGGILAGSAQHFGDLAEESIQFGTKIPDNMKPYMQNLIDADALTDSAGKKITSMAQLQFENTPLSTGLDDINGSIDHLAAVLDSLPAKFGVVGSAARTAAGGADGSGGDGASTGGYVTNSGIEHFEGGGGNYGRDVIPARLAPGEMVINQGQQAAIRAIGLGGARGGITPDALHAAVKSAFKGLEDKIDRHFQNLPMLLQHAFRGAK